VLCILPNSQLRYEVESNQRQGYLNFIIDNDNTIKGGFITVSYGNAKDLITNKDLPSEKGVKLMLTIIENLITQCEDPKNYPASVILLQRQGIQLCERIVDNKAYTEFPESKLITEYYVDLYFKAEFYSELHPFDLRKKTKNITIKEYNKDNKINKY
jgi:hypothetical protein